MDRLYIVMPAYNEEANIRQVIDDWYEVVERHNGDGKSRLVIFDDGSKDSTYAIMKEYEKDRPLLCALTKPNGGHGATVYEAYRYALEHGADYIFQTDSDGQTLPSEFEQFWRERKNWDVLIGNRCHREDGFSRRVVTKTLKLVLFFIFGVSVVDANTPYRLMKREILKKYLPLVPEGFHLTNVMLTVLFVKNKERIRFLPISFRPRQGGVNSINLKKIAGMGFRAIRDFRTIKKNLKDHDL